MDTNGFNQTQPDNTATPDDVTVPVLDARAMEAHIRVVYRQLDLAAKARYRNPANWEGTHGAGVDLADLRAALPANWPKQQVDAALEMLSDHPDVSMWPKSDPDKAAARDAAAAVKFGPRHLHAISIDRVPPSAEQVVVRLRMRERDNAASIVAALDDATCTEVAQQMGIDPHADPAVVRQRLIDTSVANLHAWHADAEQGCADGTLLYRADTEPEWVATWTPSERQQVAEAAARLQQRAATEPTWALVTDRANRWAAPDPATADHTTADINTGPAAQSTAESLSAATDTDASAHTADADLHGVEPSEPANLNASDDHDDGRRFVLSCPREVGGVAGPLDTLAPDCSHHLISVYGSADLARRVAEAAERGIEVTWTEVDTDADSEADTRSTERGDDGWDL